MQVDYMITSQAVVQRDHYQKYQTQKKKENHGF